MCMKQKCENQEVVINGKLVGIMSNSDTLYLTISIQILFL